MPEKQEIYNIETYRELNEKNKEKLGKLKYVYDEPVILNFLEEAREVIGGIEKITGNDITGKDNSIELTAKMLSNYHKFRASGNYPKKDIFSTLSLSEYKHILKSKSQDNSDEDEQEKEYSLAVGSIDTPIEINPLNNLCYELHRARKILTRPLRRFLKNRSKKKQEKARDVREKVNVAKEIPLFTTDYLAQLEEQSDD